MSRRNAGVPGSTIESGSSRVVRRIRRRQPGKAVLVLDHRLGGQYRHRVQIAGVALEPEPLRPAPKTAVLDQHAVVEIQTAVRNAVQYVVDVDSGNASVLKYCRFEEGADLSNRG